jgi:hypothetical protein
VKKCSLKKHSEIDAKIYCLKCKSYFCNKCQNHHLEIFENHNILNIDKDSKNDFLIDSSLYCNENNHNSNLDYYCKSHNKLCCAYCITKLKGKGNGQHSDCNICFINDIKEEKINKLKENIKYLEDIENKFNENMKQLKDFFDKIEKDKEDLKIKVQNIFTKIRSSLNEREEKLLLDIDNIFNENKISEELSNKIEKNLEKGKKINEDWNENKLSLIINDCINIEKNMKEFNLINERVSLDNEFTYKQEELDSILKSIDTFGEITNNLNLEKNVDNLFLELEYEYNLSSIFEKDEIIKQIKKFNCDKQKMKGWIKERL